MAKVLKKNKFLYYLNSYARIYFGRNGNFEKRKEFLTRKLTEPQLRQVAERVDYYCKIKEKFVADEITIAGLKKPVSPKSYYFDTYEFARFFDENLKINKAFGDVNWVPEKPSIVKSRPIHDENENSVLLNLDKIRHFVFIENDRSFLAKNNKLIGRFAVHQEHRYNFFEKYFGNPLCDLGQINANGGNPAWIKPKISKEKHLENKFILSLEGNDVATNLKWIMSSNSIAVMPKPKFETWFMEGKLTGGKHFIEIKSDYSDLESQLNFYLNNPEKCLEIIKNANDFCAQFYDGDLEELCSLLVLEKYLKKSK